MRNCTNGCGNLSQGDQPQMSPSPQKKVCSCNFRPFLSRRRREKACRAGWERPECEETQRHFEKRLKRNLSHFSKSHHVKDCRRSDDASKAFVPYIDLVDGRPKRPFSEHSFNLLVHTFGERDGSPDLWWKLPSSWVMALFNRRQPGDSYTPVWGSLLLLSKYFAPTS